MGLTRMTSGGANFSVAYFNSLLDALDRIPAHVFGRGVVSGHAVAAGTGLSVEVGAGVLCGGIVAALDAASATVPASSTVYLWRDVDGSFVTSATLVDPGGTAICLGRVTTDGSGVTAVTTEGRMEGLRSPGLHDRRIGELRIDLLNGRVGVGVAPTSDIHAGSLAAGVRLVSASTTAGARDHLLVADAAAGAVTVTLPPAASCPGREYVVKRVNSGANAVMVDADGSETIDGAADLTLAAQWDAVRVVSTGAAWIRA